MTADVLVVDDDEDIRFSVCEILRDEGYAVAELSGGDRVMEQLRDLRPKLVLLDLSLPGTDIEALIAELREDGWLERTTILAMSGLEDAAFQADRLGLHGTVHKPFDIDELVQRVSLTVSAPRPGIREDDRPHV